MTREPELASDGTTHPRKERVMDLVTERLASILSRGWWLLLLRGLAAIAFGVLTWSQPGISLTVLVLFFGAYSLVDGVLGLWTAIAGREPAQRRPRPHL